MVNFLQYVFFVYFRDKISGRNYKIIISVLCFEFGIYVFIGFVGRVDNFDFGFFGKVFQDFVWDIFRLVVEIKFLVFSYCIGGE